MIKNFDLLKADIRLWKYTKDYLSKEQKKLPKREQISIVKKWSEDSYNRLPDIKITKSGIVREKNKDGKWETI